MAADLTENNFRLVRAAYTAMDQSYGAVSKGFALRPIDNTGQGRLQPFDVPEGFTVRRIVEDPAYNLRVVFYKNDATNETLVANMGTNGWADVKGWMQNIAGDLGFQSYRQNRAELLRITNDLLEGADPKLILAGDSKGGVGAQFFLKLIVDERATQSDLDGPAPLPNIAKLPNENIGLVIRSSPGAEWTLNENGGFPADASAYARIKTHVAAARHESGIVEEASQVGGRYLVGGDEIYYYSEGVVSAQAVDLHRLAVSFWDHASITGGDFGRMNLLSRAVVDVAGAAAIGRNLAQLGAGEGYTVPEAYVRLMVGGITAVCLSPPGETTKLLRIATEGFIGPEAGTAVGVAVELLKWGTFKFVCAPASGVATLIGLPVAKIASFGDRNEATLTQSIALAEAERRTGAPPLEAGVLRTHGLDDTGRTRVVDIRGDSMTVYTSDGEKRFTETFHESGDYALLVGGSIEVQRSASGEGVIHLDHPAGRVSIAIGADDRLDLTQVGRFAGLRIAQQGEGQGTAEILASGAWRWVQSSEASPASSGTADDLAELAGLLHRGPGAAQPAVSGHAAREEPGTIDNAEEDALWLGPAIVTPLEASAAPARVEVTTGSHEPSVGLSQEESEPRLGTGLRLDRPSGQGLTPTLGAGDAALGLVGGRYPEEIDAAGDERAWAEYEAEAARESRADASAALAYAGSLQSALSLYGAIDSGNPLSIATSGLSFVRSLDVLDGTRDLPLEFGALGAGLGLYAAIERGDALGIVLSGGALIDALGGEFSRAIGSALGLADSALGSVMPGLGLVSSLVSGEPMSIASGTLSLIGTLAAIPGLQIAAIAVGIIGALFGGLFGKDEEEPPPPRPWGEGALHWDSAGHLTFTAIGGDHSNQVDERYGREPVERVLQGLVDYLDAHTPEGYGVIPGRLPLLHYEQLYDTFTLTLHDPVSGAPYTRSFHSTSGYAIDPPSPAQRLETFHQVYLREAEAQRAIAPEFEIDRILAAGLATSSLAAVQSGAAFAATKSLIAEAGMSGHAAVEDPDSATRAFNPIVIDLTAELGLARSLVPPELAAPALLFDLSRSGYVSLTEWVGRTQALLAVDLDADGRITHGEEVFSDARVDGAYRGLNVLARYDRDASGAIDASDPIYPALRLWLRVENAEGAWEDLLVGLAQAGLAAIELRQGVARWAEDTISVAATGSLLAERDEHRYTPMEGAVHDEVRGKGETVYVRETRALGAAERARLLGAGGPLSAILAGEEGPTRIRVPTAPFERWLVALAAGATAAAGDALAAPDLAAWTAEAPYVPPATQAQGEPVFAPLDWRRPAAADAPGASPASGEGVPLGGLPAWVGEPVREGFVVLRATGPAAIGEGQASLALAEAPPLGEAAVLEHPAYEHPYDPFAVRGELAVATQHAINNTALRIRPERLVDLEDPASGRLAISAVGEAQNGAVELLPSGEILFTPAPGFAGEARFRFTVSSPGGTHRVHEAQVLVTRAEDETSYAMAERARAFDTASLTATDEDYSGGALTVLSVGNPAGGRVGFDAAGRVVFLPDAGLAGPAGFDYVVRDAWGNEYTNRHTLLLTATRDETLRAVNDTARVYGHAELTANDANYSGAPLTIARIGATAHGTATIDTQGDEDPANDRVTFLPEPGFAGWARFAYTVRDQWGNEAENTATVGVSRIVDAPALHTMNRVGFDIPGTRLTAQNDDGSGAPFLLLRLVNATGGTAILDTAGDEDPLNDRVRFTPAAGFSGTAGFDFLVRDAWGQEAMRHVEVTVTRAVDHLVHAMNNELVRYDPSLLVADNDDGTGQALTILALGNARHGTVGFDAAGRIAFLPDPGFSGEAAFGYTVRDSYGNTLETTATVLVTRTQGQVAHTFGGAPLALTEADLVRGFEDFSGQSLAVTGVSAATGGALVREADGRLIFDLETAHIGRFDFTVEDAWGSRRTETFTLYDSGSADVVIAAPRTLVYAEHTFEISPEALAAQALPGGGSALVNFYFTDAGELKPMAISAVKNASHAILAGSLGSLPDAAGTLTLAPGENLLVTPDRALANDRSRYSGAEIGFDFAVASPHGITATHHATLRVPYVPDTRIVETVENTATRIDADELLKHSTDFSGTPLRIVQVANGSHGMAVLDTKGTADPGDDEILFTPQANYWSRLFDPATGRFHDMASLSGDAYAGPLREASDALREPASFTYTVADALGNRFERSALVGVNYREIPQVSTSLVIDYAQYAIVQSSGAHGQLATPSSPYPESALVYGGAFAFGHGPYSANDLRVAPGGAWQFTEQVIAPAKDAPWKGNWGFAESYLWVRDPAGNQSDLLALLFGGYGDDGAPNDRGPEYVALPHGTVLEAEYRLAYVPGSGSLGAIGSAIGRAAPVILDLDGDGVKLVAPQVSTVYFDMAGDGVPRRTGWASAGDGILTLDLNRDGAIVSLAEMAFTQYLAGARTDLEGLRGFDANADLVLDEADPVWTRLALWQDANQDGLTDPGELRSLSAAGIRSLSLASDWNTREEPGGNLVHGESSFERTDGSRGIAADVSLAYEAGPRVVAEPLLPEGAVAPAPLPAAAPPIPAGEAPWGAAPAPAEWVEPGPQLVLQIIADMATQLAPPGEALVSVIPEPLPIAPGAIEESPFG